jgi:hypothetical protein
MSPAVYSQYFQGHCSLGSTTPFFYSLGLQPIPSHDTIEDVEFLGIVTYLWRNPFHRLSIWVFFHVIFDSALNPYEFRILRIYIIKLRIESNRIFKEIRSDSCGALVYCMWMSELPYWLIANDRH